MELPSELTSTPPVTVPTVTISTPGSEGNGHQNTKTPRINLFLYRVTENGNLKNQEIPGRGVKGAYGHPPLSLDLHYVLTAYGANRELGELPGDESVAQHLLGSAMRVLHDYPVITSELRTVRSPTDKQILDPSLAEEFEQVKLYLDPISLEDLSKVWTALMLSYRLSVGYKVTVVQIESQKPRRFPKPVGEPTSAGPRVYAVPHLSPQIQELRVRRGVPPGAESPYPYARVGDTLVIRGRNFGKEPVKVLLGGLEIPSQRHSDDRIEVAIPDKEIKRDDDLPGPDIPKEQWLQPGAQQVSVVLRMPELPQTSFRSNQAVFMLVPRITGEPILNEALRTLTIQGERLFLETMSGETLVGSVLIGKNSYVNLLPTGITVPLPDTLPARQVKCLVSGDLSAFTGWNSSVLDIQVKIGSDGPHPVSLIETTKTLKSAARILQTAIREAAEGVAFKNTRVASVDNRLVVMPGGLFHEVNMLGSVAGDLKLSTDSEQVGEAYLSGELAPFPALTAEQPSLGIIIGGGTLRTLTLTSRPTTLADAAHKLQEAIQTVGIALPTGDPDKEALSGTRVAALGNQLLILPGSSEQVNFDVTGGDETTVAELQLRARYPVRVRVNGTESIDDEGVEMPERPS
jgi:hypothetical protein